MTSNVFMKYLIKRIWLLEKWDMGCILDDDFLIAATRSSVLFENRAGLSQHCLRGFLQLRWAGMTNIMIC